eukprot:TRINITY_DN3408_c0_g1_i1.p1 TRINITY_DN3408_c0_g1~~TRINITY_DN3408_c0_g1_i1.p1  ORF type:complete len:263 (+),score=15.60 TRINITY_DN3408_c0_g1_i1:49-837(+)
MKVTATLFALAVAAAVSMVTAQSCTTDTQCAATDPGFPCSDWVCDTEAGFCASVDKVDGTPCPADPDCEGTCEFGTCAIACPPVGGEEGSATSTFLLTTLIGGLPCAPLPADDPPVPATCQGLSGLTFTPGELVPDLAALNASRAEGIAFVSSGEAIPPEPACLAEIYPLMVCSLLYAECSGTPPASNGLCQEGCQDFVSCFASESSEPVPPEVTAICNAAPTTADGGCVSSGPAPSAAGVVAPSVGAFVAAAAATVFALAF